eukprot:COSAG02_NODE_1535_length_12053_cov_13.122794_10_plen_138_part_00
MCPGAIDRRRAVSTKEVEFVPFSIEAGGAAWGPAARRFFNECLELADGERNVDLYHWSSAKFSSTWYDTLSVLVAKGRAQVGVAASSGDLMDYPIRIEYIPGKVNEVADALSRLMDATPAEFTCEGCLRSGPRNSSD